jgi:hypothetical protein
MFCRVVIHCYNMGIWMLEYESLCEHFKDPKQSWLHRFDTITWIFMEFMYMQV